MYIAVFHIIIKSFYCVGIFVKILKSMVSINTKDIVDRYLLPVRDMQYTYLVC